MCKAFVRGRMGVIHLPHWMPLCQDFFFFFMFGPLNKIPRGMKWMQDKVAKPCPTSTHLSPDGGQTFFLPTKPRLEDVGIQPTKRVYFRRNSILFACNEGREKATRKQTRKLKTQSEQPYKSEPISVSQRIAGPTSPLRVPHFHAFQSAPSHFFKRHDLRPGDVLPPERHSVGAPPQPTEEFSARYSSPNQR